MALNEGRVIDDVIHKLASLMFNKTGHAVNEINMCHKMQSLSIKDYSNNPQGGMQNKWDLSSIFNVGADCHALVHSETVTNVTKIMCSHSTKE